MSTRPHIHGLTRDILRKKEEEKKRSGVTVRLDRRPASIPKGWQAGDSLRYNILAWYSPVHCFVIVLFGAEFEGIPSFITIVVVPEVYHRMNNEKENEDFFFFSHTRYELPCIRPTERLAVSTLGSDSERGERSVHDNK